MLSRHACQNIVNGQDGIKLYTLQCGIRCMTTYIAWVEGSQLNINVFAFNPCEKLGYAVMVRIPLVIVVIIKIIITI